MTTKDRENISKLYLETFTGTHIYGDPNHKTLDQNLYTQIRSIVTNLKGQPLQTVVDAISTELDIRVQNLDADAQEVILKLYKSVNSIQ